MPTTVADADVALHMDANPLVREIERKLGPIVDRIGRKTQLKLGIDENHLDRSATKAIRRVVNRGGVLNLPARYQFLQPDVSKGFGSSVLSALGAIPGMAAKAGSAVTSFLLPSFSQLGSVAGPVVGGLVILVGVKLVGALIAATAIVGGLTAGLLAAAVIGGSAFLAFAVAAVPAVMKIWKAVEGGNKEIAKLPKGLQVGARAVQGLKKAFDSWTKPFEPLMGRIVAQWANLGTAILPKLSPIVMRMGDAFTYLGERAEKAVQGPTFNNFLSMLEQRGPRIFTSLTNAAANFGAGLANALNTVSPFADSLSSKIEQISQRFRAWTESAKGQKDIREFFQWVKDNAPGFADGLKDIGDKLLKLGKDLASEDIAGDLKSVADAISAIATAAEALNKVLEAPGKLSDWIGDRLPKDKTKKKPDYNLAPGPVGAVGSGMDWSGLVKGAQVAARGVQEALGGAFNYVSDRASSAWRTISQTAMSGLGTLGSTMSTTAQTAVDNVWGVLTGGGSKWQGTVAAGALMTGNALSPMAPVMGAVAWDAAYRVQAGLQAGAGMAAAAAGSMADQTQDAAADMSAGAYGAGYQVGSRAAAGIWDSIGEVRTAGYALADAVASFYPGSPVKEGPLTVLNRGYAGREIAKMLAGGIEDGAGVLRQALSSTMQVPAGLAVGGAMGDRRQGSTSKTYNNSPQFTVVSPSKNPMAVADAALRRGRLVGAF